MFQTIGHKSGGFIQIANHGNKETITAQHSYQTIGTYKTVAAAKAALTRFQKAKRQAADAEYFLNREQS